MMKTKLYWTERDNPTQAHKEEQGGKLKKTKVITGDQRAKIIRALLKKERAFPKKTYIDLDPVLHSQVRENILKNTDLGKKQLEYEEESQQKEKAKSYVRQQKFLIDELKKTIPELSEPEVLEITQAAQPIGPRVTQASERVAQQMRQDALLDTLIVDITDGLYRASGNIPSYEEVRDVFKTKSSYKKRIPPKYKLKIEQHLATRSQIPPTPQIQPTQFVIKSGSPSPQNVTPVTTPRASSPVGQGLRMKRGKNETGGSFMDILKGARNIGHFAIKALSKHAKERVKDVVQDIADKPEDAIINAYKLGKKLREIYIKETKGDEAVEKEKDVGGSFKVRIPKKHVDIVKHIAKHHPEIHGRGIWQSLVKGFTLPLRLLSRVVAPLNIPVISQTAEGLGNLSDVLTDAAGTKPLI